MNSVQVVYASRHGGTAGIAERIAEVLRSEGLQVALADAEQRPFAGTFGAYVIGSGVYMGSWLPDAVKFLEDNATVLAGRPVWLFSSGPLPHEPRPGESTDQFEGALGPESGPGSGGRRKIAELSETIHPRGHRVFMGAFDPNDPAKTLPERMARLFPPVKKILPAGDFRQWDDIEAWAREIAAELQPVAAAR